MWKLTWERIIGWKYLGPTILLVLLAFVIICWILLEQENPPQNHTAHYLSVALELCLGFILIELIWHNHEKKEVEREKQKERKIKEEQLRHIKSYVFHSRMRTLFITNFMAIKSSSISLRNLLKADPKIPIVKPDSELIHYETQRAKIGVIHEYVKAKDVWERFLELGIMFGFDHIVKEMTKILQLVAEVKEIFPPESIDNMPAHEFAAQLTQDRRTDLVDQFEPIIATGIIKFHEYLEDLRQSDQKLFHNLLDFYSRAYERELAQQTTRRRSEQITEVIISLTEEKTVRKES